MAEKIFENNNVLKLVAFLLALLMWFFVNSDGRNQQVVVQQSRTFSNIPVSWQNMGNDLIITRRPANVDVVIRGDSNVLDEMTPQDLIIFVDLQGLGIGTQTVRVTGTSPRGTRITSITPDQLEVEVDEIINLQLEVEVELTGEPADGFITGIPVVSPQQVFVQGPRKNVQEVARIFAVVDIDGFAEDVQVTASLLIHDYNRRPVTGVTALPDNIDIIVPVHKPDKDVGVHVPLLGEPGEGFKIGDISISPPRIRIQGFLEILAEILRLETEPVDVSGVEEDVSVEVRLVLPEGVLSEHEIITVTVPIIPED